ncbi:MAG: hypothetical protein AB2784_09675, partial [Candidatus Thiodiazotropha endolucinida]
FEDNLKFNKHIIVTVNKANKLLGMVKRTFSFMDKELFLTVYKSLIRSVRLWITSMEPKHKEIQAIVGECSKKSNKNST